MSDITELEPASTSVVPVSTTSNNGLAVAIVIIVALLGVVGLGAAYLLTRDSGTTGSGGQAPSTQQSSTQLGYHDPEYLAEVYKEQINDSAASKGFGAYVTDLACVQQTESVFMCHADWSNGIATTGEVTVAADGKSYVATSA
jgi:hypothetical protein